MRHSHPVSGQRHTAHLLELIGEERGPCRELHARWADLCDVAASGNKTPKPAVVFREALSRHATVVPTTGGTQSDHAMTAITAAMRGLRTELYLTGQQPPSWPATCSSRNSPARRSPTLAIAATVTAMTGSPPAGTNCAYRAKCPT
jgi:hypothetical protein